MPTQPPPPIGPPDHHFLNAASGWLDLGNTREAAAELGRVSAASRCHPAVLNLRWSICASEKQWEAALEIAIELVKSAPEDPASWINRSFALHELKRTQEARELLLPAVVRFPRVSTIPYNLACYACQAHRSDEARSWLARAVEIAGKEEIQPMALCDKDLEPFWDEIRRW